MRNIVMFFAALSLAAVAGLSGSTDSFACASCGCTLSPDWEDLQLSYSTGFKLDLRYDYLDQNQLRHGTGTISSAAAARLVNNGMPQEVEKYTENNYLTLGIDYSRSHDWGVNVQLPYINRRHSTLGNASTDGFTPGAGGGQYDSQTSNLGDIKIVGRYQGFTPDCNFGVMLGVKLPTGSTTETGTSTDFANPGLVRIDPGLQPGTGTADAIIGAYYSNSISRDWDFFAQAVYQAALYEDDNFRPGDGLNFNSGIRYTRFSGVIPQFQVNLRHVIHDSGNRSDQTSTGGTLVYFSPGVVVPAGRNVAVYGFIQLPVFQDVNGVQLAPRFTSSVGVRYSF